MNMILNELIHPQHTTYICGDFNLPNIDWRVWSIAPAAGTGKGSATVQASL
mgnify:CR=1 FL=1